jgi:hypothetical protein
MLAQLFCVPSTGVLNLAARGPITIFPNAPVTVEAGLKTGHFHRGGKFKITHDCNPRHEETSFLSAWLVLTTEFGVVIEDT